MNAAHMHLILNHLPIVAIPLSTMFYIYALSCDDQNLKRFSHLVLLFSLLLVIPTYFSGDNAEDVVENLAGINKPMIEEHEEIAEVAFYMSIAASLIAGYLLFAKSQKFDGILRKSLLGLSLVITAFLIYSASLGGKIHHPEIDGGAAIKAEATEAQPEPFIEDEGDDD